jgi:hydrogenase expression/formation protein
MNMDQDQLVPVAPVTVLGIGNIILRDEGFGVRAVEYLEEHYRFSPDVRLLDGGTLGPELLHFLTGTEKLLILDAVSGEGAPGTVYRFENDAVMAHFQEKVSSHEIGIQDVLAWLTVTDRAIPNVVVLGMQPYELTAGLTLSTEMAAALPGFARRAVEELVRWGEIPTARSPQSAQGA